MLKSCGGSVRLTCPMLYARRCLNSLARILPSCAPSSSSLAYTSLSQPASSGLWLEETGYRYCLLSSLFPGFCLSSTCACVPQPLSNAFIVTVQHLDLPARGCLGCDSPPQYYNRPLCHPRSALLLWQLCMPSRAL